MYVCRYISETKEHKTNKRKVKRICMYAVFLLDSKKNYLHTLYTYINVAS